MYFLSASLTVVREVNHSITSSLFLGCAQITSLYLDVSAFSTLDSIKDGPNRAEKP